MSLDIYPLQFKPILKERIWGGEKLKTVLNKPIISDRTGESWEISTIDGDVSIVSNGTLAGKSLLDLIDSAPEEILGAEVYKRMQEKTCQFKFIPMMNWPKSVTILSGKRKCGTLCKPMKMPG